MCVCAQQKKLCRVYARSPEQSMLDNAIRTNVSCAGSDDNTTLRVNPYMPNVFSHFLSIGRVNFQFYGCGVIFFILFKFKRTFCKQAEENLIRRRILRRPIRFCTICRFPTKRTLGLDGLNRMAKP